MSSTALVNETRLRGFVDLGGMTVLLNVTDIAWAAVNHPSEGLTRPAGDVNRSSRSTRDPPHLRFGSKPLPAIVQGLEAKFPIAARPVSRPQLTGLRRLRGVEPE